MARRSRNTTKPKRLRTGAIKTYTFARPVPSRPRAVPRSITKPILKPSFRMELLRPRPIRRIPKKQIFTPAEQFAARETALRTLQLNPRTRECVRRSTRRQSLFARGIAGRVGSAPGRRRTYKRKESSNWSC